MYQEIKTNPINFQNYSRSNWKKIIQDVDLDFPRWFECLKPEWNFLKRRVWKSNSEAHLPRGRLYIFCIFWWLRRCDDDFLEAQTLVTRKMLSARALLPSLTWHLLLHGHLSQSARTHTDEREERWISRPSFGHSDALITTRILTFILSSSLRSSLFIYLILCSASRRLNNICQRAVTGLCVLV